MSDLEAVTMEIEEAIRDYSRIFPVPYALSANLILASKALACARA